MATRDRTVGIGFSNTNVYQLYKKAKNAAEIEKENKDAQDRAKVKAHVEAQSKILRGDELEIKIAKFEPQNLRSNLNIPPPPVEAKIETHHNDQTPSMEDKMDLEMSSLNELKRNFDDLQDLHSKLRFMLRELEVMVGKKK